MVDAKQSKTEFYPGSGRGAVRPAVVCSGNYIARHRGAYSRAATSKAGEKHGFQVPGEVAEDIVGELRSKRVMCRVLSAVVPCRSALSPAAGEFAFLL
jgi:hypothetical protein